MNTPQLERHIQEEMQAAHIPGVSVAVIENAELAYIGGFGVRSAATTDTVTADTIFQMASLSKPLFAYTVLKLAAKGAIALDTPLSNYLPQPYIIHDERIHLITARHILSHAAGFPNWRPERDWSKGHFENSPLPIESDPGSKFSYSGEGFWYLQHVIEQLTGQALDEVMQAHVFAPLAMPYSSYVWQSRFENGMTDGHKDDGNVVERYHTTEANTAFSLHSTTSDYARFVMALLTSPDDILDQMRQAHLPVGDQRGLSWGLGWGIQRSNDGDSLWHWGANPGFRNFVVIDPDKRNAVIILTNSNNGLSICESIVQTAWRNHAPQPAFKWLLPQNQWRGDGKV
jgi:CubicO group peptidase (beta-lactamase class C family)